MHHGFSLSVHYNSPGFPPSITLFVAIELNIFRKGINQTTCRDKNTIRRAKNMKLEIHFLSNDRTILTPRKTLEGIQGLQKPWCWVCV
jgi:CRISPR/Cas system CMR-associated protein Cmr3 (group 5 of RAMP superfamily)